MSLKAIVTDIEGTTSSISFVHDVLFPYARQALPAFVAAHRNDETVRPWLQQVAEEIGSEPDDPAVVDSLLGWIDEDRKHTALKALQGQIWRSGYENGDFQAHVYPDVAEQLRGWRAQPLKLYVYSSGSIAAQRLFFRYSEAGDLETLFDGHFDTTTGPKREAASYRQIAGEIGLKGARILFLSDIVAELDAAREAGLHTIWLERSGAVADRNGHLHAADFREVAKIADVNFQGIKP